MMEKQKQTFQTNAEKLRITPSERVWNRLESRLDQDQDKIKVSTLRRWMAIAAALLLLVTMFFLITLENNNRPQFVIQDLDPIPEASFVSYQYAGKLNEIYDQRSWVTSAEGNRIRWRSRSGAWGSATDAIDTLECKSL